MKNLLERKNVITVKNFLKIVDPSIKLIKLDATARTAQDAAISLHKKVGAIVKSLLFKTNDSEFYLCLVSGDKYISENKLNTITQKSVIKASANEVKKQTGYSIGGVSPIALLSPPTRTLIDRNLNRFDKIYAAAGHPYVVFEITFEKLCKIANAEISDFVN